MHPECPSSNPWSQPPRPQSSGTGPGGDTHTCATSIAQRSSSLDYLAGDCFSLFSYVFLMHLFVCVPHSFRKSPTSVTPSFALLKTAEPSTSCSITLTLNYLFMPIGLLPYANICFCFPFFNFNDFFLLCPPGPLPGSPLYHAEVFVCIGCLV